MASEIAAPDGKAGAVLDDHSADFATLRAVLRARAAGDYVSFLKSLKPSYARVWADIGLGYVMLAGATAVSVWLAGIESWGPFAAIPLLALLVGYWVAFLQLFLHEGSHYNLAAGRKLNDALCDLFIGWIVGSSIAKYRTVHFQHHRALGTTEDSEHTYFFALDAPFIAKSLTGWRAAEVLLSRSRLNRGKAVAKGRAATQLRDHAVLLLGLVLHAAIVSGLYVAGGWAPAAGWVAGIAIVFPFFGALRQLLEHRSEDADNATDYFDVDHGAVSRMFGTGPLAATFGGAGFNRHLLHHWEPQVSYTRLADLESYLREAGLGEMIDARTTTYSAAFARLLRRG